MTYTRQDDVFQGPGSDDSFAGLQLGWETWRGIGEHSKLGNDLVLDWNLEDTGDWRADLTTWLSVSMTSRLAVKLSYRLLFDAQPAAEAIDLFDPADLATPIGSVPVELDELDGTFTAALTLTF